MQQNGAKHPENNSLTESLNHKIVSRVSTIQKTQLPKVWHTSETSMLKSKNKQLLTKWLQSPGEQVFAARNKLHGMNVYNKVVCNLPSPF